MNMTFRLSPLVAGLLVILAACGGAAGYCEGQAHTPESAAFDQCMAAEQAKIARERARRYRP